jgi:hypothetical protein
MLIGERPWVAIAQAKRTALARAIALILPAPHEFSPYFYMDSLVKLPSGKGN